MKLALAIVAVCIPGCISTIPVTVTGSYMLPGGKGVVTVNIPLYRKPALPQPQQTDEPEAELFPVNQK